MLGKLVSLALLLFTPAFAAAQQPLSPPEKPPVPLTDKDQERKRLDELGKKPGVTPGASQPAGHVKIPAVFAGRHLSSGNEAIDALVREAAGAQGIDPCLILSVIRAESGFNRGAISPKGASGLMQLMPATASRFGVRNIFDARENVLAGTRYLRWLLDRFSGDVRLALAGYNAGEGAVEFYGLRIPPFLETQSYVRTIYTRYSAAHGGEGTGLPVTAAAVAASAATPPATFAKEPIPTYNQIIRFTSSTGDGK